MDQHSANLAVTDDIRLLSVNLGTPAYLGQHRGRPVQSGFRKQPIVSEHLNIGLTNIEGDGQADLTVHGGPEKAIYAYSADRHQDWRAAVADLEPLGPAYFGENLTVSGLVETDVRIGDVWTWGSVHLQVCQPRWPCYKFALATRRPELGKVMLQNGWTGWYFRVLESGEASSGDPIRVSERGSESVTVLDSHIANLPGADPALIERVLAVPALAVNWRQSLQRNLALHR